MSTVFVCRSCSHRDRLVEALRAEGVTDVELVRCQKICHGAVAGTTVGGTLEWFERLKGRKSVAALARLAGSAKRSRRPADELPDRLQRRRVAKRSGRRPR